MSVVMQICTSVYSVHCAGVRACVAKYTCMFDMLGDVCTAKDDVVSTVVKICARII